MLPPWYNATLSFVCLLSPKLIASSILIIYSGLLASSALKSCARGAISRYDGASWDDGKVRIPFYLLLAGNLARIVKLVKKSSISSRYMLDGQEIRLTLTSAFEAGYFRYSWYIAAIARARTAWTASTAFQFRSGVDTLRCLKLELEQRIVS